LISSLENYQIMVKYSSHTYDKFAKSRRRCDSYSSLYYTNTKTAGSILGFENNQCASKAKENNNAINVVPLKQG
ncbi:hypothetical protein N9934_04205, partial [Desulfosarcina sp.]|nr:hypothetical protein [Desulfosarcina sp.]